MRDGVQVGVGVEGQGWGSGWGQGACTSHPWLNDILLCVKRMVCWSAARMASKEGSMCAWCVSTWGERVRGRLSARVRVGGLEEGGQPSVDMVSRAMVGWGMVSRAMVGWGMVSRAMVGRGMVSRAMVGRGMVGTGMVGVGVVGRGARSRGRCRGR